MVFCSLFISSNFVYAKMYTGTDGLEYYDYDFGYGDRANYLMWDFGNAVGSALNLNSINLISSSNYSCEFNVEIVTIIFKSNKISTYGTMNIFEDYETGEIYYEILDESGKRRDYPKILKEDKTGYSYGEKNCVRIYKKLVNVAFK